MIRESPGAIQTEIISGRDDKRDRVRKILIDLKFLFEKIKSTKVYPKGCTAYYGKPYTLHYKLVADLHERLKKRANMPYFCESLEYLTTA